MVGYHPSRTDEARVCVAPGGMAERSMATVLKTVVRKDRGFESLSLRPYLARSPGEGLSISPIAGTASAYRMYRLNTTASFPDECRRYWCPQ